MRELAFNHRLPTRPDGTIAELAWKLCIGEWSLTDAALVLSPTEWAMVQAELRSYHARFEAAALRAEKLRAEAEEHERKARAQNRDRKAHRRSRRSQPKVDLEGEKLAFVQELLSQGLSADEIIARVRAWKRAHAR